MEGEREEGLINCHHTSDRRTHLCLFLLPSLPPSLPPSPTILSQAKPPRTVSWCRPWRVSLASPSWNERAKISSRSSLLCGVRMYACPPSLPPSLPSPLPPSLPLFFV